MKNTVYHKIFLFTTILLSADLSYGSGSDELPGNNVPGSISPDIAALYGIHVTPAQIALLAQYGVVINPNDSGEVILRKLQDAMRVTRQVTVTETETVTVIRKTTRK
jgi:hypothetical protein